MRIALVSDIHANALAMRAVSDAIAQHAADVVVVCGDTVGYYYWPGEVLEVLKGMDARMIRGNHEDMLALDRREATSEVAVRARLGSGAWACLADLTGADLDLLEGLPATLTLSSPHGTLLACHGSPDDPVRYVYPDTSDEDLSALAPPRYRWVVMGHTHYPMLREVDGVTFINPGSVGQPRNGVPGAAWALLDTEAGTVEFHVEDYDWHTVADEARRRDPDRPYLWEVLARSR